MPRVKIDMTRYS